MNKHDLNILPILTIVLLTLGSHITYAQTPDTQEPSKKELRQQKKALKRQAKEQLQLKSDSLKISAMLQLRNTTEANQVDSLKKVMKNSKQLAKEAILKSEEVKQVIKALDPYLSHFSRSESPDN